MGIVSLSNSGKEKTDLLKIINKLYLRKVCQCFTHAQGKGEQGLPGQALIRAFQRKPSLLSLIPDRPLEEGYETKLEGKCCTTGRPRLSQQLRPPQGVNYTQRQPGILENVFRVCHKKEHSLASLAPDPWQLISSDSQEGAMANVSSAAQRVPFRADSLALTPFQGMFYNSAVLSHFSRPPCSGASLPCSLPSTPLLVHKPWGRT